MPTGSPALDFPGGHRRHGVEERGQLPADGASSEYWLSAPFDIGEGAPLERDLAFVMSGSGVRDSVPGDPVDNNVDQLRLSNPL